MAKFDNVETIAQMQKFAGYPYHFGASVPTGSDLVDGYTWFEPGASLPQPWTWNASEGCWLSAPILVDWGAITIAMASQVRGWTYKATPFYSVTGNRILFKHLYGVMWNMGTVAHDATMFYSFAFQRFLGSAVMESTFNFNEDSSGLTVPTYATSNGVESKPSSSSMKRITELNLNLWMPGNTWWQRLFYVRLGSSAATAAASNMVISVQQVLQLARIT